MLQFNVIDKSCELKCIWFTVSGLQMYIITYFLMYFIFSTYVFFDFFYSSPKGLVFKVLVYMLTIKLCICIKYIWIFIFFYFLETLFERSFIWSLYIALHIFV